MLAGMGNEIDPQQVQPLMYEIFSMSSMSPGISSHPEVANLPTPTHTEGPEMQLGALGASPYAAKPAYPGAPPTAFGMVTKVEPQSPWQALPRNDH